MIVTGRRASILILVVLVVVGGLGVTLLLTRTRKKATQPPKAPLVPAAWIVQQLADDRITYRPPGTTDEMRAIAALSPNAARKRGFTPDPDRSHVRTEIYLGYFRHLNEPSAPERLLYLVINYDVLMPDCLTGQNIITWVEPFGGSMNYASTSLGRKGCVGVAITSPLKGRPP